MHAPRAAIFRTSIALFAVNAFVAACDGYTLPDIPDDAAPDVRDAMADARKDSSLTDGALDRDAADAATSADAIADATLDAAASSAADADADADVPLDATLDANLDATLDAGMDAAELPPLPLARLAVGQDAPFFLRPNGAFSIWGSDHIFTPFSSGRFDNDIFGLPLTTAGAYSTGAACGLTADGKLYCLGIGIGAEANCPNCIGGCQCASTPLERALPEPLARLGTSYDGQVDCGLTPGGTAYCWSGWSQSAQPIAGGPYRTLSSGLNHKCALDLDGRAYCWGTAGPALGFTSDAGVVSTPTLVPGPWRFRDIGCGNQFTCGVTVDGVVLCWGENTAGQLGDGTTTSRATPAAATSAPGPVTTFGIHNSLACAQASGSLTCWGPTGVQHFPGPLPAFDEIVPPCARAGEDVYCWRGTYADLGAVTVPTLIRIAPPNDAGADGSVDAADAATSDASDASSFDAGPPCDPSAFLLTEPTQLTIWHEYDHLLASDPSGSVSIQRCGPGPSVSLGSSGIATATLTPGWYVQTISYGQPVPPDYWTTYYNPAIISEPVPPVPPPGCAPLPSGTTVSGRFVHAASRCYEITLAEMGNISATYKMNEPMQGGVSLTVSSAATQLPSCYRDGNPNGGGRTQCGVSATGVPAGTHRIDVNAQLGTSYSLTATY